ncbi:hypothetical protein L1S32_02200 [Methanogenium sp. S4BF]|uniref:hypothetical protein n=1 Tax=Methanogenium sp. S4BF TaxID=1789226 RepID=UPI002417233A|nr:hypothetical protein [Methanogenium sp. S4BF]WFN34953.1 hypothetical protein L1S32_02200 [Methanogenium sp. S4BF]
MILDLCRSPETDNADPIPCDSKIDVTMPGALPVTVNIGLFIEGDGLITDISVHSLDTTLSRMKSIFTKTPHTFRFILPVTYGTEEDIVKTILSCNFWKENSPPELLFFRLKYDAGILTEPLFEDTPYEICEISPEFKTFGYDPVSMAITEYSSLVIIIGTGPETAGNDGKNAYSLAKRYGRSVVSIDSKTGRITELPSNDNIFNSYAQINFYNSKNVKPAKFIAEKERYIKNLEHDLRAAGFEEGAITFSYESLLSHYIKVRTLETRYNFLYALKGVTIALLSALAIFTITMQTLFFPENPGLIWIEVAFIGVIIILMEAAKVGDFHLKSIDYTFLAERIRTAFYTRIICISCQTTDTAPFMTPVRTPNDWMVMAFETMVSSGRMISCNREVPLESIREFIISAWIRKRLNFYEKKADVARFRYNVLANFALILFICTMILAIAHALGIGHGQKLFDIGVPLFIAFLSITIPAFGAAVSAIRVQREYFRKSERYSQIIRHLSAVITEMEYATDTGELCNLIKKMNEMTFREAHDWKIVSRCIDTE